MKQRKPVQRLITHRGNAKPRGHTETKTVPQESAENNNVRQMMSAFIAKVDSLQADLNELRQVVTGVVEKVGYHEECLPKARAWANDKVEPRMDAIENETLT